MKIGTKKLIINTLNRRIDEIERAIVICRQSGHLEQLVKNVKKKEELQQAIKELEAV